MLLFEVQFLFPLFLSHHVISQWVIFLFSYFLSSFSLCLLHPPPLFSSSALLQLFLKCVESICSENLPLLQNMTLGHLTLLSIAIGLNPKPGRCKTLSVATDSQPETKHPRVLRLLCCSGDRHGTAMKGIGGMKG